MVRDILLRFLKARATEHGQLVSLWRRTNPKPEDWAEYLKRYGGFHSFGDDNAVNSSSRFATRYLISIGSNVRIAGGFFSAHDGSVNMLNRAFGENLDNVGRIKIGDNVFIGYGAIVLPNVTIGDNVIVGAGTVVSRDIERNSVVVGSPGRRVCSVDDYFARLVDRNRRYPWQDLITLRTASNYADFESRLKPLRVKYFFGED